MEKGKLLERAYIKLESALIANDPKLNHGDFKFESNVIRVIDGVKYEVDVMITVNGGSDYESVFLVECKNWVHKKVDPKEISHFQQKIDAFKATKGFFVGTMFSKYAVALTEKNSRLDILYVDADFENPAEIKGVCFELPHRRKYIEQGFLTVGEDPKNPSSNSVDLDEDPIIEQKDKKGTLSSLVKEAVDIFSKSCTKFGEDLPVGLNIWETAFTIKTTSFGIPDYGVDIDRIYFKFRVGIIKPLEIFSSKFDFKTKGRIYTYSYNIPNTSVYMEINYMNINSEEDNIVELTKTPGEPEKAGFELEVDGGFLDAIERELSDKEKQGITDHIHYHK